MNKQIITDIALLALTTVALIGCVDEPLYERNGTGDGTLAFALDVIPFENPATRGDKKYPGPEMIVGNGGTDLYLHRFPSDNVFNPWKAEKGDSTLGTRGETLDKFDYMGVWAYNYNNTADFATCAPMEGHNGRTLHLYSNKSKFSSGVTPGTKNIHRFIGVAPYDATYAADIDMDGTAKTLEYTVPEDFDKQFDLMVAKTDEYSGDINSVVQMQFKHILSSLVIEQGKFEFPATIKSLEISGIKNHAVYDIVSETWSGHTTVGEGKNYELYNQAIVVGDEGAGVALKNTVTGKQTEWFFIPYSGTLTVKLEMNIGGTDQTFTKSDVAVNFEPGKQYKFRVSLNVKEDDIDVTLNIINSKVGLETVWTDGLQISYTNNDELSLQVISKKKITISKAGETLYDYETKVPFTYELETSPSTFVLQGNGTHAGSLDGTDAEIKITNKSTKVSDQPVIPLPLGEVRDLSLYDTKGKPIIAKSDGTPSEDGRCTANTYVVQRPGTYLIPLAYGNSIINNSENKDTYKSRIDVSNYSKRCAYEASQKNKRLYITITDPVLKHFVNCNDDTIKSAWILDDLGISLDECKVRNEFSTYKLNQLTDLKLVSHEEIPYIQFTVEKENFCNSGFAYLSLVNKEDETAIWSWGIWFLPSLDGAKYSNGKILSVVPVNSFFSEDSYIYQENRIIIKANGKEASLIIKKDYYIADITQISYQWGRKDPCLLYRSGSIAKQDVYAENTEWNKFWTNATNPGTIGYHIKHPEYRVNSASVDNDPYTYCKSTHQNLWAINSLLGGLDTPNPDNLQCKSIYDPSPYGWRIPNYNDYMLVKNPSLGNRGNLTYLAGPEGGYSYMYNFFFNQNNGTVMKIAPTDGFYCPLSELVYSFNVGCIRIVNTNGMTDCLRAYRGTVQRCASCITE